jgi:hypothetical protein
MIIGIEIRNIKGIGNKSFDLDIKPNKPSLLVAPNGFGKSSFARAFKVMNNRRIILTDEDYHNGAEANLPSIKIYYQKDAGTKLELEATHLRNTISAELDYFVINSQTKAKGSVVYGGYGKATAEILIEPIVIIDRIPPNISFNYSIRAFQNKFGVNGKILPNINDILNNDKLVSKIIANDLALKRADGDRITNKINAVLDAINSYQGTRENLLAVTAENHLQDFRQINYLNSLSEIIVASDIGLDEIESYLASIQLVWLYHSDTGNFNAATEFAEYRLEKQRFEEILLTFNTTWKIIRASQRAGQLIVEFPKAAQISNGQRDILTFISMLFKARRNLKRSSNILIIDEVFDYLDDANLVAAQYYITKFIQEFADRGRRLYPLILTHLNPYYFKNYAFSEQKVYYLDKSTANVSEHFVKLIRNRNEEVIRDDVAKYLLHYHPDKINKRAEFRELRLPETWGEGDHFYNYMVGEVNKYLAHEQYDPFAICGATRVKIEEIAFSKINTDQAKQLFLQTKKTREKLEAIAGIGIVSPESHYLLGIVYNEGMHWKDNHDNISPIISKLENLTIKKLIYDVFN